MMIIASEDYCTERFELNGHRSWSQFAQVLVHMPLSYIYLT